MADDTRNSAIKEDLSREALTVDPSQKAFTGAQWQDGKAQAQGYQPPQNANLMPGGTANTAGGQTKEIGFGDALEAIKLEEFTEIHKKPCVRDALMTGIGSGFGVGGVRFLAGGRARTVWTACNWAVGAWVFGSVGMYQYCQYKRQMEKDGMTRAMEILSKKDMEKKAREARREKMREDRRKAKDQEQDVQLAALAEAKESKGGKEGKSWSWW